MSTIGKLHGQAVLAGRQSDGGFGLTFAKMAMLVIHRYRYIFFDICGIDQQVMMPGTCGHVARRSDCHALDREPHREC